MGLLQVRVDNWSWRGLVGEHLEEPESQDEIGRLRTMSRTERKERRRTATPTVTRSTTRGDEVAGELTAKTLLVKTWVSPLLRRI